MLDGIEIIRGRRTLDAVELVGHRRGEVVVHTTDVVVNATGFRPNLGILISDILYALVDPRIRLG